MKALLCSIVGAALLFSPLDAAAQGAKKDEASCPDKTKAKQDFVKGRLAYRRGNYEAAILKWQDSYAACAKPLTLFNIGNAYERMGELEAALKHLEDYRPDARKEEQADLDVRIEGLKTRVAEEKKEKAEQAAKEEALKKAQQKNKREEPKDEGPGTLTYAGWITGAVGLAALAGGTITGIWAISIDGDLSDSCLDGNCPASTTSDIDRMDALAIATDVLLVTGFALTAGGVLMWLLDQPSESSTSVGVSVHPDMFGATLRRRF